MHTLVLETVKLATQMERSGISQPALRAILPDILDDVQVEVEVNKEAEFVVLPCKTSANLPKDTTVEWTRSEPEFMFVHMYPNTSKRQTEQDDLYRGRTRMNEELLRTGDLSLTLRFPSDGDFGRYICTVYRDKDILTQRVVLQQVKPPDSEGLPTWAIVLLVVGVLLVLLLVAAGALRCHFRHYFMSGSNLEGFEVNGGELEAGVSQLFLGVQEMLIQEIQDVRWRHISGRQTLKEKQQKTTNSESLLNLSQRKIKTAEHLPK
ncbi:hypothetical protein ILYODFUR_035397 [Ilyodon furcidens]|uniref:Ig-like domain-containing protein n=1 Tax=Ilyodon furcidens TaxID=33524 RepID=A0ABV0T2U6_9TELE